MNVSTNVQQKREIFLLEEGRKKAVKKTKNILRRVVSLNFLLSVHFHFFEQVTFPPQFICILKYGEERDKVCATVEKWAPPHFYDVLRQQNLPFPPPRFRHETINRIFAWWGTKEGKQRAKEENQKIQK